MQHNTQNVYVVLGGGLNGDGTLYPHATDRVRCAVNLVKPQDDLFFPLDTH